MKNCLTLIICNIALGLRSSNEFSSNEFSSNLFSSNGFSSNEFSSNQLSSNGTFVLRPKFLKFLTRFTMRFTTTDLAFKTEVY